MSMNIEGLPAEMQEEFRRNFPEMFANEVPTVPSTPIPNTPEPIDDGENPFSYLEEAPEDDIEEVEDIQEAELVEEVSIDEPIITPSIDIQVIEANMAEAEGSVLEAMAVDAERLEEKATNVQYSRFKGADWFKIVQQQNIVLAGLGGIGSYVSLCLSRLGPASLYLFDDDLFESHNMSGQFVSKTDINKYKVDVAKTHAQNFSNYTPYVYPQRYEDGALTDKVMICGFDNMEARKVFYNSWKKNIIPSIAHEYLFIDGRLLAEEFQIICITGDDVFSQAEYERDFLFSDASVTEVDCTLKQTSHMAMMIGAKMVGYFVNFCNNLSADNFPRRLPFFTHFNGLMNTYEFKY